MTNQEAAPGTTKLLYIFVLCAFLVGLDSLIVSPLVPEIAGSLSFDPELGGLLVTAYGLLFGLSAPLFGPISDRWGRKNMIMLGLFVFSIGTLLTAVADNLTIALIYRGVAGLGGAMMMPSIYALIGDTFSYERRGKVMGIITGALIGSQIIGVPAGTFMAKLQSWRVSFIAIAVLGLVMLAAVLLGIAKTAPKRQIPVSPLQAYIGQFRTALSVPSVLFALLGVFFWTIGLQGMFAYVGVYYFQNFDFRVEQIGLVAMAAAAVSVSGSIIGGRIADRIGKKRVIAIAAVMSAIGVLSFSLFTGSFWGAFVAQLFWAGFVGMGQAALTAMNSELNPKVRATVLSLNSSALYLGMTTATSIAAAMLESGASFVAIGIGCAVSTLLVLPITLYFVRESVEASPPTGTAAAK